MTGDYGIGFWAFALYYLWLGAGCIDFALHRRTAIAATSGLRESMLHGAQLACVGAGVLIWLCFVSNGLLALVLLALAGLHVALAYLDTAWADGKRRITPLEQHIHSILDISPWVFTLGVVAHAVPGWQPAWQPRSVATWLALVLPAVVLVVLPWLYELALCMKPRSRGRASH